MVWVFVSGFSISLFFYFSVSLFFGFGVLQCVLSSLARVPCDADTTGGTIEAPTQTTSISIAFAGGLSALFRGMVKVRMPLRNFALMSPGTASGGRFNTLRNEP